MDAPSPESGGEVQDKLVQHLQVASRLLREKQAPKAFGELVRASRSLPMTRRLAAALVTVSVQAGTEAAAITLLSSALGQVEAPSRRYVHRQLARILRRVRQIPRAIEALEAILAAFPDDHCSRRVLQALLYRTGKWEALSLSLENEAQEAVRQRQYVRASRAARWRARVQAEQMRNLARAAESYGQAANYLEQQEDAVGALSVRLDGLRALHASGASEAVLTAAASVCMSAAARLGRDEQARQVLEELGLIPPRVEAPTPEPEAQVEEFAAPAEASQELLAEAEALPTDPEAAPAGRDAQTAEPEAPADTPADSGLKSPASPTLVELMAIPDEGTSHSAPPIASIEAEESPEQGSQSEEPPPPSSQLWDDPAAQQRMEAQLIARQSWRELAQFYLERADRAKEPTLRAEVLTRLAELMEDELNDPSGAARIYREIVALTGDREALRQQVRLLAQRGDPSLVRRALDEAVHSARTHKERAAAYLTRAEVSLEAGERAQAKADFETAEALTPGMLLVLAGLARCAPKAERHLMVSRLRAALSAAPRRAPDRIEALRVLASLADDSLKDPRLAQWAWTEVLAEEPADRQARGRLMDLARTLGDKAAIGQLLREQLARDPRGLAARVARLELVSSLEDMGDTEGALSELRQAVRFEPGHKEAWLLLADRLAARGQIGEAAWALEHAATAMEDEGERRKAWIRLATFCRDVLKDPARAEMYARRAENLRQSLEEESASPVPAPPRSAIPYREGGTRSHVLVPPPLNVDLTPSGQGFPATEEDPATEVHKPPPPSLADDTRPTMEISTVSFPGGTMPFSDEETTANGAPEGFEPAPDEPASAVSKAPLPNKAPSKKPASKKPAAEPLDPSRELDSLLGADEKKKKEDEEEDEAGQTSPFLSAWALRVPPIPSKPSKDKAPARPPGPTREKAPPAKAQKAAADKGQKAALEKVVNSTTRIRRAREKEEGAPPPAPEPVAPPARATPPREGTSSGRPAVVSPPAVGSNTTGSRPAITTSPKAPSAAAPPSRAPAPWTEPVEPSFAQGSSPVLDGMPGKSRGPVQNTSIIAWEAPPGKMEPVRRLARARGGTTGSRKALPPEPPGDEPAVFKKVREHPLDEELYVEIAEYFERRGDPERAALMREIAQALLGKEGAAPPVPRAPLSADERSGLRHPVLRSPAGELLTCVGEALCRLFPMHGRGAGTHEPVRPKLGPGASAALEALAVTERLLGVEGPEVMLAEDNGPPFSLVFTTSPRMLVGKQAVRQVLPSPELRFYAGRALLCLGPDLMALRSLKKDQVLRGLAMVSSVLKEGPSSSPEARVVREALSSRQLERAAALLGQAMRQFDVSALADAARDSANRAGLLACGSVGPALAALRMKRALEREIVEMVRFAASERYFQLRSNR